MAPVSRLGVQTVAGLQMHLAALLADAEAVEQGAQDWICLEFEHLEIMDEVMHAESGEVP